MAFIEWTDRFSVNILSIDIQHKQLVALINQLHDAMAQKKANDVLLSTADRMIAYAVSHFATEEGHMIRCEFPERASHKFEHEEFKKKATEFQTKLRDGKLVLSIEIMNFLKDWLKHHILEVDQRYAPYLIEHGVE